MHRREYLDRPALEAVPSRESLGHEADDGTRRRRGIIGGDEIAVDDVATEAWHLAGIDPTSVVRDPGPGPLAEHVLQAGDRKLLGAQQVGQHVAGPDARELVR